MRYLFIFVFFISCSSLGQVSTGDDPSGEKFQYIGFMMGAASQQSFPGTSDGYVYESTQYKVQYNRQLWNWGKWDAHVLIEPGFYRVDHKLINFFFITPDDPNFEERRERFQMPRTFNEYALNAGLRVSRSLFEEFDIYGLLSSGPMYSEQSTERLKGGFAFSNILAAGFQYEFAQSWRLDARAIIRHTSNAGLRRPNSGHNSFGGEAGLIYVLN